MLASPAPTRAPTSIDPHPQLQKANEQFRVSELLVALWRLTASRRLLVLPARPDLLFDIRVGKIRPDAQLQITTVGPRSGWSTNL